MLRLLTSNKGSYFFVKDGLMTHGGGHAATLAKFTIDIYCASIYYVKLHKVAGRPPAA
jgi:hypothetical protein